LGATKLFVVGVSASNGASNVNGSIEPPTIAQMAGHLLNREFIDNLEADIEMATRLNMLIEDCQCDSSIHSSVEKIDIEVIAPSIQIDEVALRYIHRQPRSIRLFFHLLGARGLGTGASFASYLMFDGDFCRELMDAGYRDAWDNADGIKKFFDK
jgi:NTE family protein